LNLVVNARDAMPEGGAILIRGRAEGALVRLSVVDPGEGMDAATLARAAEPFFTTKGVGKGTGLGLPMVHGLALESGGRMEIKSVPGEGTEVALLLPVATPAAARRGASAAPAHPARPGTAAITVLAVDDDALVLMNTVAMLEDMGHCAIGAMSAGEALTLLGERTVDLVITDYAMPDVNGVQLAEAIHGGSPHLPVLLASGYAELPQGDDPGLPRLAKPFLEDDLARAIDVAMAVGRACAAP
jgi:CheY-like chemotaxis protein